MSLLNQLPESKQTGWPWNEEVDATLYANDIAWPKITIVTPSYNQGEYLEETIRSILLQNYPNLEYIIIDGGSTDASLPIIKKYERWITYWVSEKDGGQANAINKGLRIATGDVFNWINSDDYLTPQALKVIGQAFANKADILAGVVNNFYQTEHDSEIAGYSGLQKNGNLSLKQYFNNGGFYFHQPGVWLKRALLNNKSLNESLHYCFDTEMLLGVLEGDPLIIYTNEVLVNFRLHGNSKTTTSNTRFLKEFDEIHQQYTHHPNKAFAKAAKNYLAAAEWRTFLNQLESADGSRAEKIFLLMTGVLKSPLKRLNRFSMGRLKKLLF